ncbi:WD40-repeat-containing domain protein [Xylariales sp. PMI_506]|nr:WD40-repeat-containing domain protein [Xylariales sp. PMI_506]
MPSYSSTQFFQDWRYAIDQDFVKSDGTPFPYADNGSLQWGDENRKLPFGDEPHDACISSDGTRLAVAVKNDIHIIDTNTWAPITVLRGHVSIVSALEFKPNDSNILLSSAQQDFGRNDPAAKPTIIFWNIDQGQTVQALEGDNLNSIGTATAAVAASKLADLGVVLADDELKELGSAFVPSITRVVTQHSLTGKIQLFGRLQTNFQSNVFSPSGASFAYLPGGRPRTNGNAPWDIKICSTDGATEQLTLTGHADNIAWIGWNLDESLIATVSWDKTIRIWDPATGVQKFKFDTDGQNWTGAFSPNSKYFAATCGAGTLQVYLLSDGSTHWVQKAEGGEKWRRALAWHPNNELLAVGCDGRGRVLLLDVEKKEILQDRKLSTAASQPDEEQSRSTMKIWLNISVTKFLDQGRKLAIWGHGDSSIEVYEIDQQVKWRFARGGTEDGPNSSNWRNENGKVTSKGGHKMVAWEDKSTGDLILASADFDAVRIWSISGTKGAAGVQ